MNDKRSDTDRVSLHGVDPEDALRALLKVDPRSSPVEPAASANCLVLGCKLLAGHPGPHQTNA